MRVLGPASDVWAQSGSSPHSSLHSPPPPTTPGARATTNTYAIGDEVLVQVTFSTDVTVTGSPRLELNVGGGDGKPASYSGRSWRLMVPWLVRSAGESTSTGTGDVVTVRGCHREPTTTVSVVNP